jgi:hypothetical protein
MLTPPSTMMPTRRTWLIAILLSPLAGGKAGAQNPADSSATGERGACSVASILDERPGADSGARSAPAAAVSTPSGGRAAIRLLASVSAREVRFAAQPHVRIRLCNATLDSVRVLERRNLPKPVQVGTTYRNVYVAVEILGHVAAHCVRDAVGGSSSRAATCAQLDSGRTGVPARRAP